MHTEIYVSLAGLRLKKDVWNFLTGIDITDVLTFHYIIYYKILSIFLYNILSFLVLFYLFLYIYLNFAVV